MSMKIKMAAGKIEQQVPFAEASIDEALISISDLMSTLVQARLDTGVPAATGQASLRRLAKAQMSIVDASSDVLRVHGELKKISREHGGGDIHECPPSAKAKDNDVKLSIVA